MNATETPHLVGVEQAREEAVARLMTICPHTTPRERRIYAEWIVEAFVEAFIAVTLAAGREIVETRVLRWTAPGYEDSYTQYQVTADGGLYISQIALRDNLARRLTPVPSFHRYDSVEVARAAADSLLANRLDSGEEVVMEPHR